MNDVTFRKKYINLKRTDCPVCGNTTQVNTDFKKQICTNCKRTFSITTKRVGKKIIIDSREEL